MAESGKRPAQTPECLTIGSRRSAQSGTSCVCFKSVNSRSGGAPRKSEIDTATEGVTEMTRNAPPNAVARGKGVARSERGRGCVKPETVVYVWPKARLKRRNRGGFERTLGE